MMWLASVTSKDLLDVGKFPTLFIAKFKAGDWNYIPPSFCLVEPAVEALVGVKVLAPSTLCSGGCFPVSTSGPTGFGGEA